MSSKPKISYHRMTANDSRLCNGFVTVYEEAFGSPPYGETYKEGEVLNDVWMPHRKHGIVFLALDGAQVVGFGCCLPLHHAPAKIQEYLRIKAKEGIPLPDFNDTWYMSDVGVLKTHRELGIGTQLIGHRLARILVHGNGHYVLRTAAEGSNSRDIYHSIGAVTLPGIQDVSDSDQVQVNQSQSKQRVYLHGQCSLGLARIFTGDFIRN